MTFLFVGISVIVLTYIPIIGPYLSIFHTLVHESGHALAAVVTGGKVKSISLFKNTEGLAATSNHKFGLFITSIAGYPFASVIAVLIMYVIRNEWYSGLGIVLLIFLTLSLVFWVRNSFGVFWIISMFIMAYFLWSHDANQVIAYILTGFGFILLVQAMISCCQVFIISIKSPESAGDASILARLTYVPASFWGFLFLIQGLLFFVLGCAVWLGYNPFLNTIMN